MLKINLSAEEVERQVRKKISYLEGIVNNALETDVGLSSIQRNPNQGGRKSIYDLNLTDGSKLVLKLSKPCSIKQEIIGMKYAEETGIPAPGIIYSKETKHNPLGIPFIIMDYLCTRPLWQLFSGNVPIKRFGREHSVNPVAIQQHVYDSLQIIQALHASHQLSCAHTPEQMQNEYERIKKLIQERKDPDDQECLIMTLDKLFKFYRDNQDSFAKAKSSRLHGDLCISNIAYTPEGIMLIDWEHYHEGDCAEDIAYFLERNLLLPEKQHKEHKGIITEQYSKKDATFPVRLHFYTPLTRLQATIYHDIPKDELLDCMRTF
jgi:aminoglycoside phosphotransferase (APT) family kinase protein